ncbi:Outer membrane usher protein FIMD [Pseudomonas chlororaphis subsp. piscium]|uniref:fimbria/pilus outer membrane usher protein n=1 Tax=Pseudomonas chlororaphis TaxID=587753 RepID=UPI0006A65473|nr:fimbria/pilus outer membrane usher protein [Pseudomonas chlororaphis]AZC29463.1 Outer membrane usher protein FIMD [Pseudomonas chlororaphis subsp. piscium]WDG93425.1 fimbrial biogenesis outer membrane usher protein [Pseudomonas chlororaphis]SDT36803.1 outer membrane usher protein [Pseudomonas chlororaphis]
MATETWAETFTAEPAGQGVVFDSQMLFQTEGAPIDTSRFERQGFLIPGNYRIDLLVNGQWRATQNIEFRDTHGPQGGQPCYERSLLVRTGIDLDKAASAQPSSESMPEGTYCADLARYIPGLTTKIDLKKLTIDLSVPQYFLQKGRSKTYVDPANWDRGISAGLLNYNTNLFSAQNNGRTQTNAYAGLNMGLNMGSVRLRHNGTLTWSPEAGSRYQRGSIYGQTELPAWRSQLLVGESVTDANLFDSVSFRGAQLTSDDRMLPDNERFYAPVVRGTASSNAKVSIYQRGYLISETSVAPGPFEISDLQAASFGGDLNVTVTEANGKSSSFTVPFATTVQLLRPGNSRYSFTAGQIIDPGLRGSNQYVLQGTAQRGLDNDITGYIGSAVTGSYMSVLMGSALNTDVGGFAFDVTQAKTNVPRRGRLKGTSLRLSYSKNLPNSGTNFSLLAYRYSTSGYLGLHDAVALQDFVEGGERVEAFSRMRDRLDVNISQQLKATGGHFYASGSALNYWNRQGKALSFSTGYSNQWRGNSYSFAVQRTLGQNRYSGRRAVSSNTTLSLTLTIPLGRETRGATVLNNFVSHDQSTGTHLTSGVSGTVDDAGKASYAVAVSRDAKQRETSHNASLNYSLPQVALSSSFSQGSDYRQASVGASGGMILHPGGLTFAQTLSETIGLVYAPHALGAGVGYSGARVNGSGYAVVPSLTPFQLNTVDVDPLGVPDDVELQVSSRNTAPVAGAVVMLAYPTRKARSFLINSLQPNGALLPFAAIATDAESGVEIGAVGQGSRLVLRSEKDQGSIRVEWGDEPGQQCLIDYRLPERGAASAKVAEAKGYEVFDLPCRPVPPDTAGAPAQVRSD